MIAELGCVGRASRAPTGGAGHRGRGHSPCQCPVGLQGTGLGSPAVRGALSRAAWQEVTFRGGFFQVKALQLGWRPPGRGVVAVTGFGRLFIRVLAAPRAAWPVCLGWCEHGGKTGARDGPWQGRKWGSTGWAGCRGRAVPGFTPSLGAGRGLQRVVVTWEALPCPQLLQSPPERGLAVP